MSSSISLLDAPQPASRCNTPMAVKKREITDLLQIELWLEILFRLPVRSLLALKCVSKSFLSLIQNPNFAHQHFNYFLTNFPHQIDSLIILLKRPPDCMAQYGRFLIRSRNPQLPELQIPVDYGRCDCALVGSINGLLLLYKYNRYDNTIREITLWNPLLRKSVIIPLPRDASFLLHHGLQPHVRFGFDAKSDDYKVVVLLYGRNKSETCLEVYSLKTGSWRRIVIPKHWLLYEGVYANGAIHYICNTKNRLAPNVVSFDLGTEMFSLSELPDEVRADLVDYERAVFKLKFDVVRLSGVVNGRFAVFCIYRTRTDIWKMIDDSWMKEYTFGSDDRLFSLLSNDHITNVIFLKKSGELLYSSFLQGLVSFKLESKEIKHSDVNVVYANQYVESLLWDDRWASVDRNATIEE